MSKKHLKLIAKAKTKYGQIAPCGMKKHFSDCFSIDNGELLFWFNTVDNSTHIEAERIKN